MRTLFKFEAKANFHLQFTCGHKFPLCRGYVVSDGLMLLLLHFSSEILAGPLWGSWIPEFHSSSESLCSASAHFVTAAWVRFLASGFWLTQLSQIPFPWAFAPWQYFVQPNVRWLLLGDVWYVANAEPLESDQTVFRCLLAASWLRDLGHVG